MTVTEENVQRLVWYGEPKVRYFTWEDGSRGVNYEIDGIMSIDGFYCSREEFLEMANRVKSEMTNEDKFYRALELGWTVDNVSLYDEEGVEGWKWTSPDGAEYYEVGDWDAEPTVPDEVSSLLA